MNSRRFDNLFFALNDLPVPDMRDAITMAIVLSGIAPEAAKLAARGAEILRTADPKVCEQYKWWLDQMYKQRKK